MKGTLWASSKTRLTFLPKKACCPLCSTSRCSWYSIIDWSNHEKNSPFGGIVLARMIGYDRNVQMFHRKNTQPETVLMIFLFLSSFWKSSQETVSVPETSVSSSKCCSFSKFPSFSYIPKKKLQRSPKKHQHPAVSQVTTPLRITPSCDTAIQQQGGKGSIWSFNLKAHRQERSIESIAIGVWTLSSASCSSLSSSGSSDYSYHVSSGSSSFHFSYSFFNFFLLCFHLHHHHHQRQQQPGWSHFLSQLPPSQSTKKVVDSCFSFETPPKQSYSKKKNETTNRITANVQPFKPIATQPPFAPASSESCATGRWSNHHTLRYPKSPHYGHQPRWLQRPCCSKPAPPRHVRKMPHGHYILHEPLNLEITIAQCLTCLRKKLNASVSWTSQRVQNFGFTSFSLLNLTSNLFLWASHYSSTKQ